MSRALDLSKLSDRSRRLVSAFAGGYVRVNGAEVVEFVDGEMKPVQFPADVKDDIVRAVTTDGSYWVRLQGDSAPGKQPPKPKRSDFKGDEVAYFRAAAQYHETYGE